MDRKIDGRLSINRCKYIEFQMQIMRNDFFINLMIFYHSIFIT